MSYQKTSIDVKELIIFDSMINDLIERFEIPHHQTDEPFKAWAKLYIKAHPNAFRKVIANLFDNVLHLREIDDIIAELIFPFYDIWRYVINEDVL
jgi:hypothetical protein